MLIEKEDAKKAICEVCYMYKYIGDEYKECRYYPCDDIKALDAIPDTDVERIKTLMKTANEKDREEADYMSRTSDATDLIRRADAWCDEGDGAKAMTRDEAIKAVKEITGMSLDWDDRHYDALQIAIQAMSVSGDMISRVDAIDAIMGEPTDAHYPSWYADKIKALPSAMCDDCIWHVCNYNKVDWDTPSAEAEQGWIPCSERLPSESGWYLITVQGYETVADMDWYYTSWGAWNGVSSEQQVIAWMPLPTPYKGGDSE